MLSSPLYLTLLLCTFLYSSQLSPLLSVFRWANPEERCTLAWMMALHIPLTLVFGFVVYVAQLFTTSAAGADGEPMGVLSWACLVVAIVLARLGFSQVVHSEAGKKLDNLVKLVAERTPSKLLPDPSVDNTALQNPSKRVPFFSLQACHVARCAEPCPPLRPPGP